MANNTVNQINSPNTVVITDRDQNQILVTQPVTQVLEVGAVGPQGQKGDTGPQGPQGEPGPQGPPGSLEAFEGIIVTGSSIFSGSTEFTNLPTIQVTGSFAILGTGSLNGSGILTSVFTASYNTFTASYYTDSSSFSTRVTSLEAFSASLDNTFVTETELNAATSSLSASIAYLSSSYLASSASFDTRISNNSSSVVLLSGSFLAFSGSYITDSASFASRITNNSASIVALSSSFLNLSSSFLTNSSSFAARISNNSASLSFLSASYVAFSSSYNTGSFTGSFTGNGAGLYNIPASGIVGLNLSQIASGSATASISPVDGFRVNTNTIITGSLTVSGSSTLINIGPAVFTGSLIVTQGITGSLLGTASYAANALTSSYALTASYAENAGSGTQIASGSATASISGIDGFRINTNTVVTGSLTATGGLTASAAIISGDVIVQGTASINTLVVNQTQYTSGSNQLGDGPEDTQTLFGTVRIPTGSLTVTGSVFITGSTVALQGGSFSGSGANLFNIPASGITGLNLSQIATGSVSASVSPGTASFVVTSGSSTLLFVSSSGRVGIGTTTPASPLEVVGNLQITNNGGLTFYNANSIYSSHYITTANEILTATSNNSFGAWKFVGYNVSIAKNLAVGTTLTDFIAPSQTFLVSGSTVLRGNTVISGSATNSLIVRGSGTTASTTSLLVQNSAGAQLLNVRDDQYILVNTLEATQIRTNNVVSLQNQNLLLQSPWADSTAVTIETITNKAQVLIVRPTANLTLTSGTHDTQRITHTFAPTSGTGVVNALTLNQTINQTGGANGITRGLYVNPTITASADFRAIETTSGSVIFNGGNVGIGTSTPSASLHISGSSGSALLEIDSPAVNNILFVTGSGRVGIGTNNPLYPLDVSGNIRVSGSGIILASPPATTFSISKEHTGGGSTSTNLNWVYDTLYVSNSSTGNLFFFNGYYGTVSVRTNTGQTVNAFGIKGLGTTSATNALQVYNSAESSIFIIKDSGNVGIGVSSPNFRLDVSGSSEFTGNVQITGSTFISASASTSSAALQVYKSGSTVLNVEGSSGQLFSVTDSLTGSLFSVNTVAGLPVIEAFSDNTVNIGKFGVYPIKVAATGTLAVITGSLLGTASFALTASSLSGTVATSSFALTASYVNPLTQSVLIRGSGTTSATTALLVQNANASSSLVVLDNRSVGINVVPSKSLHINGDYRQSFSTEFFNYYMDYAYTVFDSSDVGLAVNQYNVGSTYNNVYTIRKGNFAIGTTSLVDKFTVSGSSNLIGNTKLTGSLSITGSAGTGSALTVYKSGSTVVSIQGSQGELFSITDSLSGSLFSVSNISGLPILEVFSDNTTLIGNYLDPMLITTQLVTANSGSTTIYSLPTASYDGAFYDYVIRSGSNSRAGQIMAIWSGSSANYTDNSTLDFGSTAGFIFGVIVSGSNLVLTGSATTNSWTVKTIIRSI